MEEQQNIGWVLIGRTFGTWHPGLPKMAEFAKLDTAAATSLMVLLVVVTIVVLPNALPLLLEGISVTFWDIASGLILLILIPLILRLFVRAYYEDVAFSLQPYFTQASTFSLLALMVLMVVLNFQNVLDLFGSGGLLASLILVILSAAGGYLLGSLGGSNKWVQALGAGQRNIAAAMVVATMNFGNQEIVMIVVYSLITLIVMTPMALELGKHTKAA
ncbi:MAG: bile acid:sodium symporter family protein [Anaerolineales bacterium]|nr:bile acid:sodium symporter family protein [Anaerolineales bacterium]